MRDCTTPTGRGAKLAQLVVLFAASLIGLAFFPTSADASIDPIYTLPFNDDYSVYCGFGCYGGHMGVDFHIGVDAEGGEQVSAAAGGTAKNCGYSSTAGYYLVASHGNGNVTRYLHLQDTPLPSNGDPLDRGEVIGYEGSTGNSTGPHLHFETRHGATTFTCGYDGTPIDPYEASAYVWTTDPPSYSDECGAPYGLANGYPYKEESDATVYMNYDNTKYNFHSSDDFEAMGTAKDFWWYSIICVPDGYMSNPAFDDPPDETLVKDWNSAPVYVVDCTASFYIPSSEILTSMINNSYANEPIRELPEGESALISTEPYAGCLLIEWDDPSEWVICTASYSKWHISAYALGYMSSYLSVLQWLWPDALNSVTTTTDLVGHCPDADTDGWSDLSERYLPTDVAARCSSTTTANDEYPDALPVDMNDNQYVNTLDTTGYATGLNKAVGDPGWNRSLDLNVNGVVNTLDLAMYVTWLDHFCWE